jgi:hypothetical protein
VTLTVDGAAGVINATQIRSRSPARTSRIRELANDVTKFVSGTFDDVERASLILKQILPSSTGPTLLRRCAGRETQCGWLPVPFNPWLRYSRFEIRWLAFPVDGERWVADGLGPCGSHIVVKMPEEIPRVESIQSRVTLDTYVKSDSCDTKMRDLSLLKGRGK